MSNILWCFTPPLVLIPFLLWRNLLCRQGGKRAVVPLWPHTWTDAAVRTNGASW